MKKKKTKESTLASMAALYKKRRYKRPKVTPAHLCVVIERPKRNYESLSKKT